MFFKRLIFASLLFITGFIVSFGQNEKKRKPVKDWMHVKVYLKNDSIAEGYLHNSFDIPGAFVSRNVHLPSSDATFMRVNKMDKPIFFGKDEKYDNEEIDSLITWFDSYPEILIKWEPQLADFSYGHNTPKPKDHLVMLQVVYRGKNVTGYFIFNFPDGFKCLYKTKEMSFAKAFMNSEQKFSERRRKTLLEEFNEYPEMVDYINKLNKKDVKDDPFVVLKKFDEVLEKSKSSAT